MVKSFAVLLSEARAVARDAIEAQRVIERSSIGYALHPSKPRPIFLLLGDGLVEIGSDINNYGCWSAVLTWNLVLPMLASQEYERGFDRGAQLVFQ